MMKKINLCFALIFLISQTGLCQEIEGEKVVLASLKDAVVIALKNNKDIQIQEKELDVAKADILGARSAFMPNLDFGGGYTHNGAVLRTGSSSTKKDPGIFSGYIDDNQAGVTFNESLYSGGKNMANLRQMQLSFKTQEETLRARKLDVEFEAKRLYYGLLLAYETERIAQYLVDQAESHYLDVRNKFDQGTSSKFDVLQSKTQVTKLIPELVKAKNSVKLIAAELNKLLGLKVQNLTEVQDKLSYSLVEIHEADFLKTAYMNKPEIILKSLGIDISKWGIQYARSNGMPQINTTGEYTYTSNNPGNMFNTRHNNWNIGFSVSFPIFDGFATKAKVDAAKAKYAQSIISKENVIEQVAVDIRQSCLDLKESEAIIVSQKDNIAEAKEALMISEVSYDNGVGTNLDVLDSQVSLGQIEQNLAEGIYDYVMAKASLDRTMGEELIKDNIKEAKNETKN